MEYEHDAWQTSPNDLTYEFRAFTSSFDSSDDNDGDGTPDIWAIPEWVSYEIHAGGERPEYESRPSTWMTIPELYDDGIAPRDKSYVRSGYQRGHLCTRELARRLGKNADWNSHNVLNAIPQPGAFNRGHWRGIEKWTAIWANTYGKIWVIAGPIILNQAGNARPSKWIGDRSELPVAVPQKCFKIVVKESGNRNRPDVLAFIYKNDAALDKSSLSIDHRGFLFSVRDVEAATGLDFFSGLSQSDQDAIESRKSTALWPGPDGHDRDSYVRAISSGGIRSLGIIAPADILDCGLQMMARIDAEFDAADAAEITAHAQADLPDDSTAPPTMPSFPCRSKRRCLGLLFQRLLLRCR
ncbi:MAG: DNA/RNA non-specific endonuclease [Planctomycetales bacterium]|nr:DNA/RNA non-specific endonuclease [Planctomycetales bacterium]